MPLRSLRERVLQTLAYEAGGLLLATPLYSLFFAKTTTESASVLVALSVALMIWSPVHNCLFDHADLRLTGRNASDRPHNWRLVHAASHEFSSCLVTVPIIMAMADAGFGEALMVDIGLTVLYTAYAYCFHIAFDALRPVQIEHP